MSEAAIESFRLQSLACEAMGSAFTGRLCRLLGERLGTGSAFGRRILGWTGDPIADALPLRAAGGFHALSRSGRCPGLTAVYPPATASDEATWRAVEEAIAAHDAFLTAYLDSAPQTNEVGRSSTLLGGALAIAQRAGLPLDLHEIGSSAGLNLAFDRYAYDLGAARWGEPTAEVLIATKWEGASPPLGAPLAIRSRQGCDLNPLDPRDGKDRARLLSYVWPDQTARLSRLGAALDMAAKSGFAPERAEAAEWVERHFAPPGPEGGVKVLMHTIVWQYLPADTKARIETAIMKAGAAATRSAPVAWLRVEADEVPGSAGVRLTLWPTGEDEPIGRADFHGRWTAWNEAAAKT